MGDDIRAPVLWRRPNAKTYTYNQQFGGSYYKVGTLGLNIQNNSPVPPAHGGLHQQEGASGNILGEAAGEGPPA